MTIYDIGDSARLSIAFTDRSGSPADPSTVAVTVRTPRGTVTTYTYAGGQVSRSGTGAYYFDVTATEAGSWIYRWAGTGALAVAESGRFEVRRNAAE